MPLTPAATPEGIASTIIDHVQRACIARNVVMEAEIIQLIKVYGEQCKCAGKVELAEHLVKL